MTSETKLLVEYARFYGSLKSLIEHVEHGLITNENMIESVKRMMVRFERERNRMSPNFTKETKREMESK